MREGSYAGKLFVMLRARFRDCACIGRWCVHQGTQAGREMAKIVQDTEAGHARKNNSEQHTYRRRGSTLLVTLIGWLG